MRKLFHVTILILLIGGGFTSSKAQQQEMYTFCVGGTKAYLLDTAATSTSAPATSIFKTWTLTSQTSYSAYFVRDTIYQTVSYKAGNVGQGGTTGKVRKISWNGTVAWEYAASSSTTQMHHDICPMPNGNVLMIVYETKSASPTTVGSSSTLTVWSEKIIEVKPTGATTGNVVWEWHLWDHLCQSLYPSVTSTYVSSVSQHPELMNVNYSLSQDWIHMNGIDYNPALDQIMLSSHYMNEVYVIDHSTTTAQAATHTGGNSGKGGDFLYRWGNPAAYGLTAGGNNSGFKVIHDAHWVPSTNPNWPNYMCAYNNNQGGSVQVVIWQPPYNGYNYNYTAGSIIGPTTCIKPTIPTISATDMGNSQQLDNGNILVTAPNSKFYEVSGTGTTYQTVSVSSNHAYRLKKCEVRAPHATIGALTSDTVCVGNSVNLMSVATSITETNPTFTYVWSSSPAGLISVDQNPNYLVSNLGSQTIQLVVTNNAGCTDTARKTIFVKQCTPVDCNASHPDVSVSVFNVGTICLNDTVKLQSAVVSVNETNPVYSYLWTSTPSGFTSATQNTTAVPATSGVFNYLMKVTNISSGCFDTASVSVVIDPCSVGVNEQMRDQNVLSVFPNPGNGVYYLNVSSNNDYQVMIYNAMGKLILSEKNVSNVNLSQFENGVYFLSVITSDQRKYDKKIILMK